MWFPSIHQHTIFVKEYKNFEEQSLIKLKKLGTYEITTVNYSTILIILSNFIDQSTKDAYKWKKTYSSIPDREGEGDTKCKRTKRMEQNEWDQMIRNRSYDDP